MNLGDIPFPHIVDLIFFFESDNLTFISTWVFNSHTEGCGKNSSLIAELRHAALVLEDRAAMAVLIQRVEAHAPDTAKGLRRLVDRFQFERIQDLLGDVK